MTLFNNQVLSYWIAYVTGVTFPILIEIISQIQPGGAGPGLVLVTSLA